VFEEFLFIVAVIVAADIVVNWLRRRWGI